MSDHKLQQRRAGVLLHPTSLPSGMLDADVERWLELLAASGFGVWQVLPLGEPQSGLSPYQCTSAFALNPSLLPEFPAVDVNDDDYLAFCNSQQFWLDDYALFKVLRVHFNDKPWSEWPVECKLRDATALKTYRERYDSTVSELKWQQYQLHKRWLAIRSRAAELGILLFGDMPIFIAHDSADVWAHREWFLLDEDGNMEVVSGVPPDYFSETGQRWGNPHYDWDAMIADDFTWWRSRITHHLILFDLIRIDHFRGLEAAWIIDASCETAVDGHWQKMPGDELLSALKADLDTDTQADDHQLPFVAEDLGIITPEVTALRKKYKLPGMSILQFGFDAFDDNPHKIKNIETDRVVYTGTHDNDTTLGWYNSLEDYVKLNVQHALKMPEGDSVDHASADPASADDLAGEVVDRMIASAMNSPALMCIIPMQDCLYLDSSARMNTPGTIVGNWLWRFDWRQCDQFRVKAMRSLIEASHRSVGIGSKVNTNINIKTNIKTGTEDF